MALVKGTIKAQLLEFYQRANQEIQEDTDQALNNLADQYEQVIFAAIKQITITIPIGTINVAGAGGISSNAVPIILTGIIS